MFPTHSLHAATATATSQTVGAAWGRSNAAHEVTVYVPDGITTVTGVVLRGNSVGGDTRGICTETEWQAIAQHYGLALVGMKGFENFMSEGEGQVLLNMVEECGGTGKLDRAELKNAPIFIYGFSNGAQIAYDFTCWKPERVLGFVSNKGGYFNSQAASAAARAVPGLMISGSSDTLNRKIALRGMFEAGRSLGALWSYCNDEGVGHAEGSCENLVQAFLKTCIEMRYPSGVSPTASTGVTLKLLDATQGWLADMSSWANFTTVASWDNHVGDRSSASWLPSREMALLYRGYATAAAPISLSAPTAGTVYDAGASVTCTANLDTNFSGWQTAEFYLDGRLAGTVSAPATPTITVTPGAGLHSLVVVGKKADNTTRTSRLGRFLVKGGTGTIPTPPLTVSVEATTETVGEDGVRHGAWTFTLNRSATEDTVVAFTVSGTATAGTDYPALPASITIPSGETSATLTVRPTQDAVEETDENVVLTLTDPGIGSYGLVRDTATVTILDDDRTRPTVTLAAPVAGRVVAGQSVSWSATATGSPVSVALAVDGTVVETDTSEPYGGTWTAGAGFFRKLTAVATDAQGGTAISEPVVVNVTSLPAPWRNQDLGCGGTAGSASYDNGSSTLTVVGSGPTFVSGGSTAESFQFVSQPVSGDVAFIVRLATNSTSSATAGIMLRERMTVGSRFVSVGVTGGGTGQFACRTNSGRSMSITTSDGLSAPRWLKLTRSGNAFSGYTSADGSTWTQIGSTQTPITDNSVADRPLGTNCEAGLFVYDGSVLGGNNGTGTASTATATATFDNISLTGAATPRLELTGLSSQRIEGGDTTPSIADGTDFGMVGLGGTMTRSFLLTNSGSGDATITAIALSDSRFTLIHSPSLPLTLAEGAAQTLQVTYTPTSVGSDTCALTVTESTAGDFSCAFRGRAEDASRFAEWATSYHLSEGNTASSSDPDGDGIVNLLEYALGSAPDSSASRPNLTSQISDLKLKLTFTPQRSDVTYTIEASSDLSTWPDTTVLTGLTVGTPTTHTDTTALSGTTTKRFLRLKISQ
jgi:hypothetical protein